MNSRQRRQLRRRELPRLRIEVAGQVVAGRLQQAAAAFIIENAKKGPQRIRGYLLDIAEGPELI